MAWKKGEGKGQTGRFNIRLEDEVGDYYRRKAKEHGVSVSEHLRRLLTQGMIAETALEIEQRMRSLLDELSSMKGASYGAVEIPENVLKSIYLSEYLLTAIVEARDVQQLYAAQDKAAARVKQERGQ